MAIFESVLIKTSGIILGMLEKENPCSGCENNCCEEFHLFWSGEEIEALVAAYPFLKVIGRDVALIGNREMVYRIMECARLQEDGSCFDYPNNRPSFCEKTGRVNRPAKNCQFNDLIKGDDRNK